MGVIPPDKASLAPWAQSSATTSSSPFSTAFKCPGDNVTGGDLGDYHGSGHVGVDPSDMHTDDKCSRRA